MKALALAALLTATSFSLITPVLAETAPVQVLAELAPLRLSWKPDGSLAVSLAMPADQLVIERGATELARLAQPGASAEFKLPPQSGPVTARLLDAKGNELARSAPLSAPISASTALQLHVAPNRVFGTKITPLTVNAGPGSLRVLLDGEAIHSQEITAAGTHVMPALTMPPGRHRLQVEHTSQARTQTSPAVQIFSFGIEPLDHSYLLADKYSFSLYWIKEGVLHRIYPVATGRPSLPTQPGFWLIGGKDVFSPASDWGSFRLRIYRENQYTHHWSGYAVHGTNKPNSIGTEASHGCLRMFNKDVTELHAGIQVGTPLLIEEHMKVYIEDLAAPKVAGQ